MIHNLTPNIAIKGQNVSQFWYLGNFCKVLVFYVFLIMIHNLTPDIAIKGQNVSQFWYLGKFSKWSILNTVPPFTAKQGPVLASILDNYSWLLHPSVIQLKGDKIGF